MRLSDVIRAETIVPELKATDRNSAIRELVQTLAEQGAIADDKVEILSRAAIARENAGSTGFGKGVAVPHVKHEAVTHMAAAIGRSGHGIDFAALDRAPVFTVFLLMSPAHAPEQHLAAMERIFRYLQRDNFRRFLRQAETREAVVDLLREADDLRDE